jgi:hypothetical protein
VFYSLGNRTIRDQVEETEVPKVNDQYVFQWHLLSKICRITKVTKKHEMIFATLELEN